MPKLKHSLEHYVSSLRQMEKDVQKTISAYDKYDLHGALYYQSSLILHLEIGAAFEKYIERLIEASKEIPSEFEQVQ